MRFKEYVAIENPNVKTVGRQPGIVASGDVIPVLKRFVHDTPELACGAVAWLTTDATQFSTGLFIPANRCADGLVKQKDQFLASSDLKAIT